MRTLTRTHATRSPSEEEEEEEEEASSSRGRFNDFSDDEDAEFELLELPRLLLNLNADDVCC